MNDKQYEKLRKIKVFIIDIDGTLTDGKMHYGPNGEMMKSFFVRDGLGLKLLAAEGIETAIISARNTPIVEKRAADLDISHVIQGAGRKDVALAKLLEMTGFKASECAYIGDDIIDLPIMTRVGFSFAVHDAHHEVLTVADHVTQNPGGAGAVREACDMILRAKGRYDKIIGQFLS